MPDKTPQGPIEITGPAARSLLPGMWFSRMRLGSSIVPFPDFSFSALIAAYLTHPVPTPGARWGFPGSPTYLFLHATACGLRRTSTPSPYRVLPCCLRCTLKPSASATSSFRSCTSTSGRAITPTAYRILCLRLAHLVRHLPAAPPWTQDSIRVGGWPLPDGDSHPARYAELISAR